MTENEPPASLDAKLGRIIDLNDKFNDTAIAITEIEKDVEGLTKKLVVEKEVYRSADRRQRYISAGITVTGLVLLGSGTIDIYLTENFNIHNVLSTVAGLGSILSGVGLLSGFTPNKYYPSVIERVYVAGKKTESYGTQISQGKNKINLMQRECAIIRGEADKIRASIKTPDVLPSSDNLPVTSDEHNAQR
jgi:hypothetical protein